MAFKESNVNNDGLTLYGEVAQLQINFWNGAVVFKMFPAIPEGQREEGRARYDYKKRIQVTTTADNAVLLGHKIMNEIVPAAKEGKSANVGISSASVNMIYISTGKTEGKIEPFIGLMTDIGTDHIPQKKMIMPLGTKRLFSKYDDETGEYEITEDPIANLMVVGEFLVNCINTFGASVHALDVQHAKKNEADSSFKNAVANKLGINFAQPVNYISRKETPVDPWATASGSVKSDGDDIPKPSEATSLDEITGLL